MAEKPKNAGGRSDEVIAKSNLGAGQKNNPIKLCANLEDQKLVFAEKAFDPNCVLYVRNCKRCHFRVEVYCAKVMIEGCEETTVDVVGKVITSTAELWKCRDVTVTTDTKASMIFFLFFSFFLFFFFYDPHPSACVAD